MASRSKTGNRTGTMMLDAFFYDERLEGLTFSAFRLAVELNQQFSGYNNGNLCAAQGSLRFNWNDRTLKNARTELVQAGVIELTRMGRKKRPNLYALTHLPINDCEKNNIRATTRCSNRATGKRNHYFPVRIDPRKKLLKALSRSKKLRG